MARLLVIGGDGLVGADLTSRFRASGHDVIATSRRPGADLHLDLASPRLSLPRVDAAIVCAAVAQLDQCAADPAGARRINVTGTLTIARKLIGQGAAVVFLSTDKVTDGRRAGFCRHMPTRPLTEYGLQKAEAERELLRLGGDVSILRLSKVLDASLPLLRDWHGKLTSGRPVDAFADMYLAPVDLPRIAALAEALALTSSRGIFHCTGATDRAYADLAVTMADLVGAPRDLVRAANADPVRQPPETRPRHSTLEMSRERRLFHISAPKFDTVVTAVTRELHGRG
ncbi:MAG: sugar nucleotide-binding protein [Alphaproteobacteria bacterium]